MQKDILAFLLTCARRILSDKSDEALLDAPVQDVLSHIHSVGDGGKDYTSFADVLLMAPYEGWDSMNFSRLQGYADGAHAKHKNHVWALREDPQYFADTVCDHWNHLASLVPSTCNCHKSGYLLTREHANKQVGVVISDSYLMLHGWGYLSAELTNLDKLQREGALKQEQARVILQTEIIAKFLGHRLLGEIFKDSRAAPLCRKLLCKDCDANTYTQVSGIKVAQKEVLDLFAVFRPLTDPEKRDTYWEWPSLASDILESADRLLLRSAIARKMITSRILGNLTDLSIITECVRQTRLWSHSPEVVTRKVSGCGCKIPLQDEDSLDFFAWNQSLEGEDFNPPLELTIVFNNQISYPEHEVRSQDTVEALRTAEQNLNDFWSAIDAHYEEKTGLAQHEAMRSCLEKSGEMHRISPRIEDSENLTEPVKVSDKERPRLSHDKASQITGTFDRMSLIEKVKTKTRGNADPAYGIVDGDESAEQSLEPTPHIADSAFQVDKRAHKVFTLLFPTIKQSVGKAPKSVK